MLRCCAMSPDEGTGGSRRVSAGDRRARPRGGRRQRDVPGRYPPVLVADSDDRVRRVMARGLERCGFDVVEAARGETALELARRRSPRVVVAEATLPRDDEFQTYVQLNRIPCIVTITNDEGVVPPGTAAVLEKPFSLPVLLGEVFRVLRSGTTQTAA